MISWCVLVNLNLDLFSSSDSSSLIFLNYIYIHNLSKCSQSVGSSFFVKMESITILKASSIILGSNSYNNGDDSSKHGLVFISISHGLYWLSIIKS